MNKLTIALLGFFLFLSCLVSQSHGRQGDALNRFLKTKLNRKNGISTNIYEDIDIVDQAKLFPQAGLKRKDKIQKLPGQPAVDFTQYGGYVTVNETAGRAFFYYFVEAEHDKVSKPLVLWLNGGPGCSSLAYGAMEELGPFRVHSDGKTLYENPFAWNKVANVLFLESPAGVGFSYSNTTADYAGGDWKTAKDNYLFLANWLERFPEYKSRDFYISGESYAGHYVPELAHTILHHNKKAGKNFINLKGIMIGNAVINDETDEKGMYDYFWTHSLISDEDHFTMNKYCNFSPEATTQKKECVQASNNVGISINSIDIYNIYYPLCMNSNLTVRPKKTSPMKFDPCSDYYVYAYLNHPDVQKALHANVTHLSYDWQPCSDVITSWEDGPYSMLPFLKEFMANGLRVWVFSGDTDGRVPVTSTRYSLDKLELPVKTSWHPWFLKGEVGGYTIQYKGDLTFATVRGAGHEVPSYQPRRALSLIKYFLDGKPLPSS